MKICVLCSKTLNSLNKPIGGFGKLNDGNEVCHRCYSNTQKLLPTPNLNFNKFNSQYIKELNANVELKKSKDIAVKRGFIYLGITVLFIVIGFNVIKNNSNTTETKLNDFQKDSVAHIKKVNSVLDPWDGSHIKLTKFIKDNMNDPNSYENVSTQLHDMDDYILVIQKYRGKNAYGGVVTEIIRAKTDIDGNIIEIESEK